MNKSQSFTDFEKAFYSDGYKIGMQAVENNNSLEALYLSISEMYSAIEELIDSLSNLADKQDQPIQCKKGCDFCCHQPVYALDYEMQFLNTFIRVNFTETEKLDIKKRARKNQEKLLIMNKSQVLNSKLPCPLLIVGSCSAYEARPMACRIYLSTDVNSCQIFYKEPENKSNFPALLDFPMRAGRMMNEGFKSALKTSGAISKEYRIDEKLFQ
jgi:Fe-S-cluster containining protein